VTIGGVRLLVVVGKGGAGRSTTAAALSRQAAKRGKRVLLIDALGDGGSALALGLERPPRPGVTTEVDAGGDQLCILTLSTEAALDEYVRLNLPIPIAPSSLGPIARMFDFVATAAPAVREILVIGKIGHGVRGGGWDLVVVDAPATGHVVEVLSAPRVLGELVGFGPLASETAWLADLLADGATTAAVAVTLAEELPVTETFELVARIRSETDVRVAGVVVNRLPPAVGAAGVAEGEALIERGGAAGALAELAIDRSQGAASERKRVDELGLPIVEAGEDLDDPVGAVVVALDEGGW